MATYHARPSHARSSWPLLVSAGVVGILALGLVLDRPREAEAAADNEPAAPPEDEGQRLRKLYFPSHPNEEALPGLGSVKANGVDLQPGAVYIDQPLEEVYYWYLDNVQGPGRAAFGQLNLLGLSWVAYADGAEPNHPRTLSLIRQGEGTLVFSTTADAAPLADEGVLPPDVPHPPGVKNIFTIDGGGGQRTVRYDAPKPESEVRAFYDQALSAAGWERKGPLPGVETGPQMVRYERQGRSVLVIAAPNEVQGGTSISLVLTGQ